MVMEGPTVEVIINLNLKERRNNRVDDMQENEYFRQRNNNGRELEEENELDIYEEYR